MNRSQDILEVLYSLIKSNKGITICEEENKEIYISYEQLCKRSSFVAQKLKDMGAIKGSEVFIRCRNLENFLYSFWGCVINQCIAIPIESSNSNYGNELMSFIMEKLDKAYMLYDNSECIQDDRINAIDIEGMKANIYTNEDIFKVEDNLSLDDIVYIIYSSGTTGEPHGVVIRKYNISANVSGFAEHYQIESNDKFLAWSPLTHCYGLVTFHLVPLMNDLDHCLIPSKLYMQKPLIWFDMVDKYRATRIGTLPFALRHFNNVYNKAQVIPQWDLSCVKSMFIGGEQVNYQLIREFSSLVNKYNFEYNCIYPLYGLSEATIMCTANKQNISAKPYLMDSDSVVIGKKVDCRVASEDESKVVFLEMGTPLSTIELRIKDEEGKDLPSEYLGYVCVSGPCITTGYYKNPEATERAIRDNKWLFTGDVGFIHEESLIIVGREKELVVANGKKFACITIENIINNALSTLAYGKGTVCNGNSNKMDAEKVILFFETELDIDNEQEVSDFARFGEHIKSTVFQEVGVTINQILPIKELPRTYSGKIFRRELTQSYNEGKYLKIIEKVSDIEKKDIDKKVDIDQSNHYTKEMICVKISEIMSELFDIKVVEYNTEFAEYGIISINIPSFMERINQQFTIEIPVSAIFSYTNISKLATFILEVIRGKLTVKENNKSDNRDINEDKIAIVGMSCRCPAGSDNLELFWDTLLNGKSGIVDIPKSRWNADDYYSEDENQLGKMYCKKGGYLNYPIDEFDAGLFNISPQEAKYLDPQQRLLLELVWEAYENAGLDISKYFGSDTGVYLGISSDEYSLSGIYSGDLTKIGPYSLTGGSMSTICGRVSYLFGFEGPCVSVDTACSSSLTALHLACNALKNHETNYGIVAGVNLILTPVVGVAFSKLHAISPDGICKSFDETANGYGRAEGGGVLLVKRLSDAIRDNDNILGVISSSGINQDGRSNGLTAPNGLSQSKLMKKILMKAKLKADDVDYVEMHGTGTPLGDPIEVNAVAEVYGIDRSHPLRIGSVKSNIGHLEPAAGIISIIKVILSLKNEIIPANLHFKKPNPYIEWDKMDIEVVGTNSPWLRSDKVRRAAINGFGFGGSNAHIIIEEYKQEQDENETSLENGINYVLKITAKNELSLKTYIFNYIKTLELCSDNEFIDFLYSANRGRVDFDCRVAVASTDRIEMIDKLKALLIGGNPSGVYCNIGEKNILRKARKVIMMFTGQGSQYLDMGKLLFDTNPVFKDTMVHCDKLFRPFLLRSILELLYKDNDSNLIEKTVYAQPLIFSINYALYKLWDSLGIRPEIVTGHSIGEFTAAVVSGIMSLEDAIKIVAIRGRLMDSAPGNGSMGTIFANSSVINNLIKGYENEISIAAHNGNDNYVISGDSACVEEILTKASNNGIRIKRLKVSHAFHSVLMDSVLNDFKSFINDVRFSKRTIRYLSCLYARELDINEILDVDYWTEHIRRPVNFYEAITSITNSEDYVHLEIGANRVLSALCKLNLSDEAIIIATLNRQEDDRIQMANAIAELYVSGIDIDWDELKFNGKHRFNKMILPTYPYNRSKYGLELMYDRKHGMDTASKVHPVLGERIESIYMENVVVFQRKFTSNDPYFMSEHIIFDVPISPAAAHMSFVLSAIKEIKNPVACIIKAVEFRIPLAVSNGEERIVQLCLKEIELGQLEFQIVSRDVDCTEIGWKVHATGKVEILDSFIETKETPTFKELETWESDVVTPEEGTYALMRETGFYLGEGFRRIIKTSHFPGSISEYVSFINPAVDVPNNHDYIIYPGVIDSIFQTGTFREVAKRISNDVLVVDPEKDENMVPYYLDEFAFNFHSVGSMLAYTSIIGTDNNFITFNVTVYNENQELILKINKMMAKVTNRNGLLQGIQNTHMPYFYQGIWEEKAASNDFTKIRNEVKYIIIGNDENEVLPFASKIEEYGISVRKVLNKELEDTDGISKYIKQDDFTSWGTMIDEILENANGSKIMFIYYNGSNESSNEDKQDYEHQRSITPLKRLFYLVQAIQTCSHPERIYLKVVTKNVQNFGQEKNINMRQAPLWGFGKVLGIEASSIYQGIIDIDDSALIKGSFVTELMEKTADEVCLHNDKRYVERIVKTSLNAKEDDKLVVKEEGAYLITGGTGAVGLVFADTLIKLGAKHLILCCRKEPNEEVADRIAQFEGQGVKVQLLFADVSNQEQLSKAFNAISGDIAQVKGIIHGAGVLNDMMLNELTWKCFEKVLNPKMQGIMNIMSCVHKERLDFVIMLSSITSLLGNMGQSNYAAANYFLNQYSDYLRNKGIPAYTMCWGPWATGGMASTSENTRRNMSLTGLIAFSNEVCEELIIRFFERPKNKLMLVDINWKTMGDNIAGNRQEALLEKMLVKSKSTGSMYEEENKMLELLYEQETVEDRKEFVCVTLQKICSNIMGFTSYEQLNVNISLSEQGADSLIMFTMRSAINKAFKTEIEVSSFYNYPTLVQLSAYLIDNILYQEEKLCAATLEDHTEDILSEIEKLLD